MNDKVWIDEAWRLPDDLVERVGKANYADAWKLEIERAAQARAILTDLIAEIQDESSDDVWFRMEVRQAIERAESRLREVAPASPSPSRPEGATGDE